MKVEIEAGNKVTKDGAVGFSGRMDGDHSRETHTHTHTLTLHDAKEDRRERRYAYCSREEMQTQDQRDGRKGCLV